MMQMFACRWARQVRIHGHAITRLKLENALLQIHCILHESLKQKQKKALAMLLQIIAINIFRFKYIQFLSALI